MHVERNFQINLNLFKTSFFLQSFEEVEICKKSITLKTSSVDSLNFFFLISSQLNFIFLLNRKHVVATSISLQNSLNCSTQFSLCSGKRTIRCHSYICIITLWCLWFHGDVLNTIQVVTGHLLESSTHSFTLLCKLSLIGFFLRKFLTNFLKVFLLHDGSYGTRIPEISLVETLDHQFTNGNFSLKKKINLHVFTPISIN